MKLYELVNQYHIGTELSCAEAMFQACNEYYHLHLTEESRKMFSMMGIGMQTEMSCCGAFTVAVGMIGLMSAEEGMHDCENIRGYELVSELSEFFMSNFSSLQCCNLQEAKIDGYDNPCHKIVEETAKKLEELLESRNHHCLA